MASHGVNQTYLSEGGHVIDRTGWESGPWDSEPDRVQWRTLAGLPGLVVRNQFGALCGYAAVPPGHPLHSKHYDEPTVEVHGGLTYSGLCQDDGPICHVPEPGEPADVWWFGFDCAHFMDRMPATEARERQMGMQPIPGIDAHYRDLAYVQQEVEALAIQLVALGNNG